MRSGILQKYVGEVIVLNSIPEEGAKSDGMVLVNFPNYLKEIFGEKVKVIKVKQKHYMIPNSPGVYAKGLSK